ncbi:MAG: hypothetical protein QGI68_12110 [Pseudomonadales bacterium]|jgi:catechol 2,3-dioxygenase-like lactoylglutathione lyase family enzyme|nr:hypothetical protein [Pseudomonadales bacterium]HJN52020.1 hypothetical protein [Pseudomonadales bacterium]|tara:strand:- start:59 stop:865 length:807 start_codon:yes stop_codon:yes gene_type:complete
MPTPNHAWHHVHLVIADWHAAAKWHDEHTPADCMSWDHDAHRGYKSEVLRSGPNLVLIQKQQHATEPSGARIDSIGITVMNLAQVIDKWTADGGSVEAQADDIAVAVDPWGLRCELVETTDPSRTGYSHVNIAADDPESLLAWYETNVGGMRSTFAHAPSRLALQYDTMQLVFMPPRTQERADSAASVARPLDHFGWFTDDLNATCDTMLANGVIFPKDALGARPNPPPQGGPRTPAFAQDPSGIWFELVGVSKSMTMGAVKVGMWEG